MSQSGLTQKRGYMSSKELHAIFLYLVSRGARRTVLSRVEREYSEALAREWTTERGM